MVERGLVVTNRSPVPSETGTLGKHKAHIDKPVNIPAGEFEGKRWSNAT